MFQKASKKSSIHFTPFGFPLIIGVFLVLLVAGGNTVGSVANAAEHNMDVDPIWLGTHYEYPFGGMATRPEWMPRGEEDWRRDLAKIAETGLNSIRIRIGMDSDLDEVEMLLDIAHENGLTVLFGTATFYVNDEFVEKYPDSKIIGGDGSVLPVDKNDVRWQRACIDHPFYRQDRNRILEECVSRFKDHPSVIVWDVHNEPWIAPIANACFCDYTLAKYRASLKKEFNDVSTFNQTFGTGFTDLESIRPPAERTRANEEFYIHWREFIASDVNDFLLEGREIFRKYVPDALITHNVTNFVSLQSRGQDWWLFKDQDYNLLTMSRYLGTNEKTVGTSMGFEVLKAMNPGKPAWVTEFQGGPFPTPGPNILYSGKEIEIELNNLLGHGMKGLYFYRWDPLLNGAEPMVNGMIEPDSYDTDRRLGLQKAIKDLEPDLPFIAKAESLTPSVGIYFTRDQVMRSRADDAGDFVGAGLTLLKATRGAYQLLSDIGYEASCIVHGTGDLDKYKTVVFPHVADLSQSEIDDIEAYVANGGSAIIDLPPQDPVAAARFAESFGIQTSESEKLRYLLYSGWSVRGTGAGLNLADNAFAGYCYNGRLLLEGENTVLKFDDNGAPAALIPPKYEGRLLITGCQLFYTYHVTMHKRTRQVVQSFLSDIVEPDFVLEGAEEEFRPYLEARVLEDKDSGEGLLFIMNRDPSKSYSLKVTVKGYNPVTVEAPSYDVARVFLKRKE